MPTPSLDISTGKFSNPKWKIQRGLARNRLSVGCRLGGRVQSEEKYQGYRVSISPRRYIFDTFSRLTWVVLLKSKAGWNVFCTFRAISRKRKPRLLRTDKGMKFLNSVSCSIRFTIENDVVLIESPNNHKTTFVGSIIDKIKNVIWTPTTATLTWTSWKTRWEISTIPDTSSNRRRHQIHLDLEKRPQNVRGRTE